jgi:RND family efflux transporter MFP subunit
MTLRSFSNRKTLAAVGAALALAPVAWLALPAGAADEAKKPATARPAMTVTTVAAQMGELPNRVGANGNIAAWQEASVGAEVGGLRIAELRASVGDTVRKGQVLAVLAGEAVRTDLAQTEATAREAQVALAEAAANAQRARSVDGTGAVSQQQIAQMIAAEESAKARLEAARAVAAAQRLRLSYTQVLAPDAGVITQRAATMGAVVAPGQELFRLIRQGRLEWRAEVTSNDLARLAPGTRVQVTTSAGTRVQGRVRLVGPTVDPQTRFAIVYVDLPAHPQLRAGLFARGEFDLAASGALTLPDQAVVVRDGFDHVFVIGADHKARLTKVEIGRRAGDRVEVLRGLGPQAQVAVQGAGFLNDGDTVRVVPANAPSNASK